MTQHLADLGIMAGLGLRLQRIGSTVIVSLAITFGIPIDSIIAAGVQPEAGNSTLLGNYLAGRVARSQREFAAAARFYQRALKKDPNNPVILKRTFLLEAAVGNWDRATLLAEKVIAYDKMNIVARYCLGVQAFREGKLGVAKEHFGATRKGLLPELTTRLARAWILLAQDRSNDAFKMLAASNKHAWSRFLQRYQMALMADLAGRYGVARNAYANVVRKKPRGTRVVHAYARHAANTGDIELAEQILKHHISRTSRHTLTHALLADIEAGKKLDLLVQSPLEGLAEAFYLIGDAMTKQGGVINRTVHLRLALLLKPEFPLAQVALGDVYESMGKYDEAIAAYERVDRESPLWMRVQIRKGQSLNSLKRVDDAKTLLEKLAEEFPQEPHPLATLGDILRSHRRFEEAKDYLGRAIELMGKPEKQQWTLYYLRGVCFEQMKRWPEAEKDFKQAMKLSPDQAVVLNYLGYSWIDQGRNLKKAMPLVRRAVKLKPQSGEYVDSLGWAYYRLGKFEEAVEQLERAVELKPSDPVINDHLGDAYWTVGRRREAGFQWKLALSLKPEPAKEKKIKKKLEHGL